MTSSTLDPIGSSAAAQHPAADIICLGTQGWFYKDWVGPFYPPRTQPSEYLSLYSRVFQAVELDTTFYGPPRPETVCAWRDSTPDGFVFAAKMPKLITHDKRLVDTDADLVEFLTALQLLGPKLGPILVQLPPSLATSARADLERFVRDLPTDFRYAVEFRHPSWASAETFDFLREHRLAWTIVDLEGLPSEPAVTTDFTYVRWLGHRPDVKRLNRIQIDRSADLQDWARQLDRIARHVQRIYGFMNNHYAGHSPASLRDLQECLGIPTVQPSQVWGTPALFESC